MLAQQSQQPTDNPFEALCAQIEEYDHLPAPSQLTVDHLRPLHSPDHEAELDAEILAGLVSP